MRRAFTLALGWGLLTSAAFAADTKVVLVPGHASHGKGDHEFHAGLKLLDACLDKMPGIQSTYLEPAEMVPGEGWPKDEKVFEGAKTIVFFMDGGGGHPAIQGDRLKTLRKLAEQGVGLVFMHYAVEVPKGAAGDTFLDLIGGYYGTGYSTNPHWVADVKALTDYCCTSSNAVQVVEHIRRELIR